MPPRGSSEPCCSRWLILLFELRTFRIDIIFLFFGVVTVRPITHQPTNPKGNERNGCSRWMKSRFDRRTFRSVILFLCSLSLLFGQSATNHRPQGTTYPIAPRRPLCLPPTGSLTWHLRWSRGRERWTSASRLTLGDWASWPTSSCTAGRPSSESPLKIAGSRTFLS